MVVAFAVALAMALAIRLGLGPGYRLQLALRVTARWSFLWFWLASAGGVLWLPCSARAFKLWRSAAEISGSLTHPHISSILVSSHGLIPLRDAVPAANADLLRNWCFLDIPSGAFIY